MNKVNKIVFIGYLPGFGGAEKSMIMVANGLARMGNHVTIISLKDNNVVYEIDELVEYIFIPDQGISKFSKLINRFLNLKSALSRIRPNVIISFWLQPAIYVALISKFNGYKNIYSERSDPGNKEYLGLTGIVRSIIFQLINGFIFQSTGAKNYFGKNIQSKSIVIPNPVYIKFNDYQIPKFREKIIVNVGRLHTQKNQKLLIEAFSYIEKEFPEYQLHIYGEGELKNELQELINKLELGKKVYLMGTTKDISRKIVNSSLFVLSSDYEGMPNALLEAMALGVPCISAECPPGAPSDLIDHGENGLLFPTKNAQALANCIKKILSDVSLAEQLAINAKQICHTHSSDKILAQWNEGILKISEGNVQ
ncbi:glycosyltransferase family 4 protein [Anaerospora sp.]|uniref:glycosyltransferase family 4 protein n=1 Tax=Anaerospora sp. TaxID=1960278 RepID=UPI00289EE136|nr:glycosyltransferase family 4 protein [Anaerospora sp.]